MKLSEIDGQALARDTLQTALAQVDRILFGIAPFSSYVVTDLDGKPIRADNVAGSVAGDAVLSLVRYAQTGVGLDAPVSEYCISLIPVAPEALDDSGEPDLKTPLGLVVTAAIARERIVDGLSVSTSSLGILASVTPGYIRQLVANGELPATRNEIAATDAARWLWARGVAGFGSPTKGR
jgi:hypothetical protein